MTERVVVQQTERERVIVKEETSGRIIKVVAPGPPGPPGAPGTPGAPGAPGAPGPAGETFVPNYVHTQEVPASTWTIDHNLGFHPNVTVVDTAGTEVEGDLRHVSATQIIVTFGSPFAGKAFIS